MKLNFKSLLKAAGRALVKKYGAAAEAKAIEAAQKAEAKGETLIRKGFDKIGRE